MVNNPQFIVYHVYYLFIAMPLEIANVPDIFRPHYHSTYPSYSSGKHLEEIYYDYFLLHKETIHTNKVYLPVFWTSYYILHNYGESIHALCDWLETLDPGKEYFTIVQYACGIYVAPFSNSHTHESTLSRFNNIMVFSAGGGGINYKKNAMKQLSFNGYDRWVFVGNPGEHAIPLVCAPTFPNTQSRKDIFCSFMGRIDTHPCRVKLSELLSRQDKNEYQVFDSVGYDEYVALLNRSTFTLAPRGCGYTSFRIYEAILAGSIPVYIWSDCMVLPFCDELEWTYFCVILHEDTLQHLPAILKSVDVSAMQKNLKRAQAYMATDATFDYMKRKLAT